MIFSGVYNICRNKIYNNNSTKKEDEKLKYSIARLLYYMQCGILFPGRL